MFIDTMNDYQEITVLAGDTLSALNVSFRNASVWPQTNAQGHITGVWSLKPHVCLTGRLTGYIQINLFLLVRLVYQY
jgi:hypothetical protein